jgi:hypothetical protein
MAAGRDPDEDRAGREDRALDGDQRAQRGALWVACAAAGQPDDHQPGRGDRDADPLPPTQVKAEEALGEHGEEDEPAGQDRLHDRQRRQRERTDVQTPGHDRHDPADQEPPGAKETDGAAQWMSNLDRRGDHRAALLEQEGEVGGHRRSKREDQAGDHGQRPAMWGALLRLIGRGSLSIRVALTEERGLFFMCPFLSSTRRRGRKHARRFIQH